MASQFTNPFTNPGGFFSSQEGGFFAPPKREGFGGFLSDPRLSIGMAIAQGQPIGKALLGGAIQAKQIEESFFPDEERNLKVINDQVIDLTNPDDPINLGNYGTAEKVKYEKAIVNDPEASNFGETIFVNNQKFGDTIQIDGVDIPKYLPDFTPVGSEPKDYFDKTTGTIVTIPQSVASADRARYIEPTANIRDAIFNDPDGKVTKNDLLKLGTKYQMYDAKTGKNIKIISENQYNANVLEDPTYAERFSLAPLGSGSADILTSGYSDLYKKQKEETQTKIQTASNVTVKINDLIANIAERPDAATVGVGAMSQFATGVKSFAESIGLANADTYQDFVTDFTYIATDTKKDWKNDVAAISAQFGINESIVRDTAYALAAARGQEGRGLSDKDWENAVKILSGGVNASEKIGILTNVANRLKEETVFNLSNTLRFLRLEDTSEETDSLIRYYEKLLTPETINAFFPTLDINNIITTEILEPDTSTTEIGTGVSAEDILGDFSR